MCCTQRIRFPLLNLCGPQWITCFVSNCVVHSESGFWCRILWPQRFRFSLPKVWSQLNCVVRSELGFRCPHLRCSQQIRFLLLNSFNRSDSGFCCQILLTAVIHVFTAQICVVRRKIVLSIVNHEFAAECVVRRESGFRCRICVVRSESSVCCLIVMFTANQVFVVEFFDHSSSGFCCPMSGRSELCLHN